MGVFRDCAFYVFVYLCVCFVRVCFVSTVEYVLFGVWFSVSFVHALLCT